VLSHCSCKIGTADSHSLLQVISILKKQQAKILCLRYECLCCFGLIEMSFMCSFFYDYACVFQAILGNTRASEIIKLAPFLAPFTSRVKIFTVSYC